jgi:hypothetical protein
MNNLDQFVKSQKHIKKVSVIFREADCSPFVPVFTQLFSLDSLKAVNATITKNMTLLPLEQINNRHVQELCVDDIGLAGFAHCLRMFPSFTRLVVSVNDLLNNEIVALVNSLESLVELTISGRSVDDDDDDDWDETYLQRLQIKNLEKISFREYLIYNRNRIDVFTTFCKNHPNLKEFKMESSDFGFGIVEVIVKNSKRLEKLVISTETSTFVWNQDEFSQIRKSKGVRLSKNLVQTE